MKLNNQWKAAIALAITALVAVVAFMLSALL